MGGRHRARTSKSNLIVGSIAASVGVSSVLAAAIVELVEPRQPTPVSSPAPAQPLQSLTQQGTVVAVSPDSLTTRSADGLVQTFAITPNTNAITPVAVNDEVTVVGTSQGGSAIATAVADTSSVGPQGRPMDYGL